MSILRRIILFFFVLAYAVGIIESQTLQRRPEGKLQPVSCRDNMAIQRKWFLMDAFVTEDSGKFSDLIFMFDLLGDPKEVESICSHKTLTDRINVLAALAEAEYEYRRSQ
jgi:hypothetical protein